MTMSHYYSDIGTIEVDAYINTRRAQVDSIQTINSDEIAAFLCESSSIERQLLRRCAARQI